MVNVAKRFLQLTACHPRKIMQIGCRQVEKNRGCDIFVVTVSMIQHLCCDAPPAKI